MTAPTKNNASTPPSAQAQGERPAAEGDTTPTASSGTLEELARDQEELTRQIRRVVAQQVLDHADGDPDAATADDRERAGRLVTVARAELLGQLQEQEQERARRQLAAATRSSEDAAAGVVRSVTTIIGTILPPALLRPEEMIEAAYLLADQGLRVTRRLALTFSSTLRGLTITV